MIPRTRVGALLLGLLATSACTSDEWPVTEPDGGDDDSATAGADDDEGSVDSAHLEVFEPEGASIFMIDEAIPLLAELRDDDDLPVDFGDVVWKADAVEPTLLVGLDGEVVLPPGRHDITAIARLPNGDRLETRVEDVRVQSRWTGHYEGTATLNVEVVFMDFPLSVACQGPVEFFVDVTGEMVDIIPGTCSLSLVVLDVMASYEITGEFDNGLASGTISYDLDTLGSVDMEWTGAFIEDGFGGSYDGNVSIPLVGDAPADGVLSLRRTSPFVD